MEMVLTYRMKALEKLGQPCRDPGTLEFLSWLLVKSLPLIPSDMWPNGFLSLTDSFKAGTIGLVSGKITW